MSKMKFPKPSRSVVVYTAGPYTATKANPSVEHNIQAAWRVAFDLWKEGYTVICPQVNSYHMDAACHYDEFIIGTMEQLSRCDAVVMIKGWEESRGSIGEHQFALDIGMPIRYL